MARRPKEDGKRVKRTKDDETVNACTPQQLAGEIERAAGAALVNLSPSVNTAIKVGYAAMTAEQIAANIDTTVKAVVEKFVPGKWKNVKSIYVKGPETASLPIWMTQELWLEQTDIVGDDSEEAKALLTFNQPNVGKKRKSLGAAPEEAEKEPVLKKVKKSKAIKAPEADEPKLDKEIVERKSALKKQKKAAKAALDV
jgi:ribosome biogenesis protein UTP30